MKFFTQKETDILNNIIMATKNHIACSQFAKAAMEIARGSHADLAQHGLEGSRSASFD